MNMARIICGDALMVLEAMQDQSVHCCVTSPPYWGLRDYNVEGQIGLEDTAEEYVGNIRKVMTEVRRVLKDDGTLWLNIGDSYRQRQLKGMPWKVAFALQEDGWFLRQDIIWHKPNPLPESVRNRCTKAHEYIFLLTKNKRYYYNFDAIKEPAIYAGDTVKLGPKTLSKAQGVGLNTVVSGNGLADSLVVADYRNKRSVWTVTTKTNTEAHFAIYPPELIRPCILAGCPPDGTVLDPFAGTGTTAEVALHSGRNATMIELNEDYIPLIEKRIGNDIFITVDIEYMTGAKC